VFLQAGQPGPLVPLHPTVHPPRCRWTRRFPTGCARYATRVCFCCVRRAGRPSPGCAWPTARPARSFATSPAEVWDCAPRKPSCPTSEHRSWARTTTRSSFPHTTRPQRGRTGSSWGSTSRRGS
jgi:hypothetical protein